MPPMEFNVQCIECVTTALTSCRSGIIEERKIKKSVCATFMVDTYIKYYIKEENELEDIAFRSGLLFQKSVLFSFYMQKYESHSSNFNL